MSIIYDILKDCKEKELKYRDYPFEQDLKNLLCNIDSECEGIFVSICDELVGGNTEILKGKSIEQITKEIASELAKRVENRAFVYVENPTYSKNSPDSLSYPKNAFEVLTQEACLFVAENKMDISKEVIQKYLNI